jgi:Protein of unknown function (DUF4031)
MELGMVYVDDSQLVWRGQKWCHLVADSIDELHAFAAQLGLKRHWFQERTRYPHYDVTVNVRARALGLGACPGDKRTIVACAKSLRAELVGNRQEAGTEALRSSAQTAAMLWARRRESDSPLRRAEQN